MNITKATAAVEYQARQLAAALDAVDRCDSSIQSARDAALAAVEAKVRAQREVEKLTAELEAAEATLAQCLLEQAAANGVGTGGSGSAHNPTIRIEENP